MCVAGYDVLWSQACAPHNMAVIDSHLINHVNKREASGNSNTVARMVGESLTLLRRLKLGTAWQRGAAGNIAILPRDLQPFTPGEHRDYVPSAFHGSK